MRSDLLRHFEAIASQLPHPQLLDDLLRSDCEAVIEFHLDSWTQDAGDREIEARILEVINWFADTIRELPIRGETFDALMAKPMDIRRARALRDLLASNKHLTNQQISRLMSDTPVPWDRLSHRHDTEEWLLWECAWTWLAAHDNSRIMRTGEEEEQTFHGGSEEAVLTLGLRMYNDGRCTILPFSDFLEVFGKRSCWLLESLQHATPATSELRSSLDEFLARR